MSENSDIWLVPTSWSWSLLSNIGEVVAGGTPSSKEPSYWGGDINWISPADLTGYSRKTIAKGNKSLTPEGLKNSSAKVMPSGSIHFSSRAPIGYVVISAEPMSTNQGFKSLVPARGIFNGYVYFYLKASKQLAEKRASGTTFLELSGKAFSMLPIPIPPLNEQKRIVAKIEELFSELDKGIESLQTAREQLKVYRQAVLKHAFEGKLTEQWRKDNADKLESPEQLLARIQQERDARYQQQLEDWKTAVKEWEANGKEGKKPGKPKVPEKVQFDEAVFKIPNSWATTSLGMISDVSGGLTKNQKRNSFNKKMKYLRVANVYADQLLLDDVQEIGVTDAEERKVSLAKNDLLVVEGNGSVDHIGRVALWDASISSCGHQNHLIRVRFDNPHFSRLILLFLLSPIGRDLIVKEASSTSGLHTLSISKVSNLQIPLLSLAEAAELMRVVDDKMILASRFESELDAEIQRAETLRQSILKKAFSGQLVPQDPNDEPASELLARIQAEKAVLSAKAKKAPAKRARKAKEVSN